MKPVLFLFSFFITLNLHGQVDSTANKSLKFTGDFRFRIEHDWNSQNSQGVLRKDRSRLRYRFRLGLNYAIDKSSSFGGRIRSGNINDQQGPHVTIGGGEGEFGLVSVGLEKLFYQYKHKNLTGWIGKNSIPLKKDNELFWNDNTFPEGVGLKYLLPLKKGKSFNKLSLNAGHFIIRSENQTFDKDSYLQLVQLNLVALQNRLTLFPGYYFFNQVGNLPDAMHTFTMNYSIFHLGSQIKVSQKYKLQLGVEFYQNLTDYADLEEIPTNLKNQKRGFVISAKHGSLKKKGNWLIHLYYANLQKFAIVDYFAQNDWARWDYSAFDAAGSRISNFQGIEIRIGYAIKEKFNLVLRSYFVEELMRIGDFKENGSRIRLDLNIGF